MRSQISSKDYSKFIFKETLCNKRRLVHAVVRQYTIDHPDISFAELKAVFPRELQGAIEVVALLENAENIERTSGQARHFLKDQELLKLKDGTKVAVCTQWAAGLNFERFLKRTDELGYEIRKIE